MKERGSKTDSFSIQNKTKGKLPRLPFVEMKKAVLGNQYDLSLVFIGQIKSQNLNHIYRQKNKPANVLSFPLSKTDGEIFLCLEKAKKEAKNFGDSYTNFVGFLFIHGLLHLKGMQHGSRMEEQEKKLRKKFHL